MCFVFVLGLPALFRESGGAGLRLGQPPLLNLQLLLMLDQVLLGRQVVELRADPFIRQQSCRALARLAR